MWDATKLKQFSGYEQPARIIRWLQDNGIPFILNKDREPVTTEECVTNAIQSARPREVENAS